ncbi:hypothetical protein [Bailinhaonella thermotolerans]|uniref:Uncharacterized protein n=1 Tax=Bailinhaonella thermotolerans TaxID=1070861 RepID=A0A3A4AB29_9ACTN|nr:hypothetical protein [Bailinhaonella thermotolerans]RJL23634.1 hypothetical protein D5H75_32570 [Bailinhaonella thermotolerans]
MGIFGDGRLRSVRKGPSVLLPYVVDAPGLLEYVRLMDPDAYLDGDVIRAAGVLTVRGPVDIPPGTDGVPPGWPVGFHVAGPPATGNQLRRGLAARLAGLCHPPAPPEHDVDLLEIGGASRALPARDLIALLEPWFPGLRWDTAGDPAESYWLTGDSSPVEVYFERDGTADGSHVYAFAMRDEDERPTRELMAEVGAAAARIVAVAGGVPRDVNDFVIRGPEDLNLVEWLPAAPSGSPSPS